MTTDLQ